MRFLSLCSGIEAASVAWAPMGWKAAAFAEIEAFPSAVLAHHYPDVPNLGDITKFKEWPGLGPIDIVCGGTPCQSFSVAGLRKGLADPRGNLSLTFLAIVDRYRPRYVVWENVPGVLSDDGGRSFASILGGLGQLGYGWAYRVLDAQYVRVDGLGRAVPQRRRRVFVVGCLGDWRRAAAILSEPESVLGDSPPRRQAGEGVARPIGAGSPRGSGYRNDADTAENLVGYGGGNCSGPIEVAARLAAHGVRQDFEVETFVATRPVAATLTRGAESSGKGGYAGRRQEDDDNLVAHSLRAEGFDASEDGTGRGTPLIPVAYRTAGDGAVYEEGDVISPLTTATDPSANIIAFDTTQMTSAANRSTPRAGDPCHPLAAGAHAPAIAIQERAISENLENGPQGKGYQPDLAYTLEARSKVQAVQSHWAVRRLMPIECERLQGFPDGYTAITYRGKPAADGPRYKALGNSWAVNCPRWIGRRIEMVERLSQDEARAA